MGQSNGPEGQAGEPASSAMPEGGQYESTDPSLLERVQRVRVESSYAIPLINLDLLLELDEPFLLIEELERAALFKEIRSHRREEWGIIAEHTQKLRLELKRLNEPPEAV